MAEMFWNIYSKKKNKKNIDTYSGYCNCPNNWTVTVGFYNAVMHPRRAAGTAISVDPDHTAPLGAVWP